jgi:hypothetical protein
MKAIDRIPVILFMSPVYSEKNGHLINRLDWDILERPFKKLMLYSRLYFVCYLSLNKFKISPVFSIMKSLLSV